MRLKYTILYVDDVVASIGFYEAAFGLERRFVHESAQYGELSTGSTTLAFSSRSLMASLGKSPGHPDALAPVFEIAFESDDVEASFARAVAAGAKPLQTPRSEPWGQITSYVADSDGYLVEICSPVQA